MTSRVVIPAFSFGLVFACSTTPATNAAAPAPCTCAGIVVPEGTVDAACGSSVCVGHTGYRCADDGQSTTPDPDACPHNYSGGTGGKTGTFTASLPFGDDKRTYAVHVPSGYTGETGVPLVLHFHGWRPAPAGVKDEVTYVWKPAADEAMFIAVAPEGAPCPELNPEGDPFLCFDEKRDDAWVQSLVDTIKGQYNVDLDRVFLSGHSGGAFFVQGYGLLHAAQFRAAVTFSGGCIAASDEYGNSCAVYEQLTTKATRKIPYYIAHHPSDRVVPQRYSVEMKKVLSTAGFNTRSHFKKYEAGKNGHSIDPTLVPGIWAWLQDADPDFVVAE